jgi:thiol:disulfide interchange protein DsbC
MNLKIKLSVVAMLMNSTLSFAEELPSLDLIDLNEPVKKEITLEKKEEKVLSEINDLSDLSKLDLGNLDLEMDTISKIREKIENIDPKYKNAQIFRNEEVPNLYTIKKGTVTLYITEDAKYIIPTITVIKGKRVESIEKIKEENRVKQLLEKYDYDSKTVKYPAVNKKDTIIVFSDFTCPFCKAMHSNIDKINDMGIEVQYIPYSRAGFSNQQIVSGLQKIMCSETPYLEYDNAFDNRKEFMASINPINSTCKKGMDIVKESIHLGYNVLELQGTPIIYTKDGVRLGGWRNFETFKKLYKHEKLRRDLINSER